MTTGKRPGRWIEWLFLLAAAYGLLAILPLYLAPAEGGFYRYAFAGAAAATQLLYAAIGLDFARYRPLIWVGVASKISFAIPCLWLIRRGLLDAAMLPFAILDLALAAAFVAAWVVTRRR